MSNQPKRREPGQRVFPQPKPQLTLIKPTQEHKPLPPEDDEVKEMLREMRQRQSKKDYPESPEAA